MGKVHWYGPPYEYIVDLILDDGQHKYFFTRRKTSFQLHVLPPRPLPPPNLESWLTKQVLLRAGTPWVAERFMNLWRGRFGRSYGLRRHNRAFCPAASSPSNKDGVGQGRRSSDCRLFLTAGDSQEKAQISSLQSLLVHLLHKWYMFDYYPSQRNISKLTAKAK